MHLSVWKDCKDCRDIHNSQLNFRYRLEIWWWAGEKAATGSALLIMGILCTTVCLTYLFIPIVYYKVQLGRPQTKNQARRKWHLRSLYLLSFLPPIMLYHQSIVRHFSNKKGRLKKNPKTPNQPCVKFLWSFLCIYISKISLSFKISS